MRTMMLTLSLVWLSGCGLFDGGSDTDVDGGTDADGDTQDDSDSDDGTDVDGDDIVPQNCRSEDIVPDALPNLYEDRGGYAADLAQGGQGVLLVVNDTQIGTFDLACSEGNPLFCDRAAILIDGDDSYIGFRGQFEILEASGDATLSLRLIDPEFRLLDAGLQPVSDGDCVAASEDMVFSTESVVRLPSDCNPLTIDPSSVRLDGLLPGFFSADVTDPNGEISGELFLEFFSSSTGLFDLSNNANANYSTCEQCISVVGDDGVRPFQSRGVADVNGDPSGTTLDVRLTNVEVQEVTLGDGSVSTPVPNGRCWALPNPLSLEVD